MNHLIDSNSTSLRRRAAEYGPGLRGVRRPASARVRRELVVQLRSHGFEVPSYLLSETTWVDRSAKLLEAGDYPDKQISILVEDLVAIEDGFELPVPILVEHTLSPIEWGYVTSVRTSGRDLFGTLTLHSEADALLRRSGARSLSVGLAHDLHSIQEVSVVRHSRVESAQLFHEAQVDVDGYVFDGEERRDFHRREADRILGRYVAEGKLCPAQQEMARALLKSDVSIDVGSNRQLVRDLLVALIEHQPTPQVAPKSVISNPDDGAHLLLPEEIAFYQRYFPGASPEAIASRRLR